MMSLLQLSIYKRLKKLDGKFYHHLLDVTDGLFWIFDNYIQLEP